MTTRVSRTGSFHVIRGLVLAVTIVLVVIGRGSADPMAKKVDCDKNQTISHALETADQLPIRIEVEGTCNEHVTIDREDVTLVAGQSGATVNGPNPGLNTITIVGNRALIDGLTVTGGRTGIVVTGARATIVNCVAETTGRNGITFFQGGSGTVDNSIVQKNAMHGIAIESGSATIIRSQVLENGENGILLFNDGSARIGIDNVGRFAGNEIRDNRGAGVQVNWGSSAALGGNTITGNGTNPAAANPFGVGVFHGRATIVGGNTIEQNVGAGVQVSAGSVLIGDPGFGLPTSNRISRNGALGLPASVPIGGVYAFLGSQVDIRGATITDNVGHGVRLLTRSTARFDDSTVTGNTGDGIRVTFGSGVHVTGAPVNAAPNGGMGLRCDDAESSSFGPIIGVVACSGY
jgi:hypothetical protein